MLQPRVLTSKNQQDTKTQISKLDWCKNGFRCTLQKRYLDLLITSSSFQKSKIFKSFTESFQTSGAFDLLKMKFFTFLCFCIMALVSSKRAHSAEESHLRSKSSASAGFLQCETVKGTEDNEVWMITDTQCPPGTTLSYKITEDDRDNNFLIPSSCQCTQPSAAYQQHVGKPINCFTNSEMVNGELVTFVFGCLHGARSNLSVISPCHCLSSGVFESGERFFHDLSTTISSGGGFIR